MIPKNLWLVIVVLLAFALAKDQAGRVEISLQSGAAFASAKGKAKFKDRGGEQEFELEIQGLRALAGQKLSVLVRGKAVAQIAVSNLGAARLNLNSDQGQKVPDIKAGTTVEVLRQGERVVWGKF